MITWYSRPLLDVDGQVSGFITFGLDDTERKLAEAGLQQALDEIHVLYEIASITNEYSNLSHLLDRALERILSIMQSQGGVIHLWDDETDGFIVGAARGVDADTQPAASFVQSVFEGAQAHYSPPLPNNAESVYIGVPMRARGQAYGTISIIVSATENVGHDEAALLTSIADQIGIAVENARLNTQAHQLAVAEERRRLARDLHDSVTQSLYSLTLFAEAGQRLLRSGDVERVDKYLERLSKTAQDALREMRLLLYELRPYSYESGKLVEALQQRLDAVERRSGLTAHLITGTLPPLSARVEDAIYHIALEALNNSLKHAFASAVMVKLEANDVAFEMEVVDNGSGFESVGVGQGGMGLSNMRDRAAEIGATLAIDTHVNEGTAVRLTLPLQETP
jgi:signal transduction histidine kinase